LSNRQTISSRDGAPARAHGIVWDEVSSQLLLLLLPLLLLTAVFGAACC
jgi:hypothetical protein